MSRAVLSLGSNLGDRLTNLRGAVLGLAGAVRAVSPIYETAPWGPVAQGDYLNAVVVVDDDDAGPADWLRRAHELEQAAGRTRGVRFGPRTLDVDVVTVDDVRSDDPELTLPHPRAAGRAFVLVPWLAIGPDASLPGVGDVATVLAGLDRGEVAGVRLRSDLSWSETDPGRRAGAGASTANGAGPVGSVAKSAPGSVS